ncbi:MAG: c-type cytochrome [Chloroflexi bacterium]|nr:c-type cytochrome [Chloroflexota bacterium]MCY3589259.1 c-type cytochrome [Chloroflexota bacterium]MCY3685265.1 c-type cytochrome [Chloroflexota bacterium]MDE2709093.1 c-type cytochrome [Chloroflexota bacterium]
MRRWFQTSLVLAALVTLTALIAACGEPEPVAVLSSEQSEDVSGPRTGEQVFASTCAACHGAGGEGAEDWMVRDEDGRLPPPPLNGEGHTWHHSDGVLYGIVSDGGAGIGFGSNMPGFKEELTREEIIAVLEYVKTWWEGKEIDGFPIAESQRELSEIDPYPVAGG